MTDSSRFDMSSQGPVVHAIQRERNSVLGNWYVMKMQPLLTNAWHEQDGLEVVGKFPTINKELRRVLDLTLDRSVVLIIDLPTGFGLSAPAGGKAPSLVWTQNSCPEYLADIRDVLCWSIVVGDISISELRGYLERVAVGENVAIVPSSSSSLTSREREALSYCARGFDNQEIAEEIGVSSATVRNYLHSVFSKLGVKDRTQASLYYWGIPVRKDCRH